MSGLVREFAFENIAEPGSAGRGGAGSYHAQFSGSRYNCAHYRITYQKAEIMKDIPVALGLQASFGFGDRIGLATPGHVAAMKRCGAGIAPIYPQQSIREMTRTARSPQQVMQDAMSTARNAGWTDPIGADADHLKTTSDVDVTASVGFTFFTIDPSGNVDQRADDYNEAALRAKFEDARGATPWFDKYVGKSIALSTGTRFTLSEQACMRAAVKYGRAIAQALELGDYIDRVQRSAFREHEIELSVDETDQPTTLAEHYIIADEPRRETDQLHAASQALIGDDIMFC